jgi:hypothetical protein
MIANVKINPSWQMSYKVGAKLFIEKGRKEKGKEKREYKPIG